MAKDKESVTVTPLPLPDAVAGQPLPDAPAAPKRKTPMQKAMDICDEIDTMVGHSHAEVRDTVRSLTAKIRDFLS